MNFCIMTPLQLAQKEWERKTQPHPKRHPVDKAGRVHIHDFLKYGQAIAFLNFDVEYIERTKLEKLPGVGRGAAIPLVEFLKSIADKYHLDLYGHAKTYTPYPPISKGPVPSQEDLEAWYRKRDRAFHPSFPKAKSARWRARQMTQVIFRLACRCSRAIRAVRWWTRAATWWASSRPS